MRIDIHAVIAAQPKGSFNLRIPELLIDEGQMVVAVGPSGSGKSTLLDVCAGVIKVTKGHIAVLNTDLSSKKARTKIRRMGTYMTQRGSVVDYLTAAENVLLAGDLAEVRRNRRTVLNLLNEVGLEAQANKKAANLSGGQRQRVAMASALYRHSPLVWADEPTSALDSETAMTVFKGLRSLAHHHGATVLCVTHDVRHAKTVADTIIEVNDGVVSPGQVPLCHGSRAPEERS